MSSIVPFSNKDPEKEFVCPYDKVHVVRACRFNQHLRKCRKNHGGAGFHICVFNQSHHIPEREYEHHVLNCPDKHVIEQDEEKAQGIQKHNLPPVDFNPVWNKPPSTENWDVEFADHQQQQAEKQMEELEVKEEVEDEVFGPGITTLISERPDNWDRMTPSQKKNHKRRYQKQQQRMKESGLTHADFERSKNPGDWTEHERDAKMKLILTHYPPPTGKINASFIDYKSVLNQFCQKNRINAPKYFEAAGGFGGFACEVTVKGETYMSHGAQKTKKDASHSAAKWALLALDVPEEDQSTNTFRPRPVRTAAEMQQFRAAHEVGLLHQAGQLPTGAARSAQQASVRQSQGVTKPAQPQPAQPQAPRPQPPRQVASATMPDLLPPAAFKAKTNMENDGWTTVPQKSARGRGRGTALAL
eukprot:Seg1367.6 transcript_id=Seg1367.6/GoldUCD/mRNA.D3Y31 product="Gametocyte-specific factor 1" protein_id=Seg1367.6/GoldUCD/D3Y31